MINIPAQRHIVTMLRYEVRTLLATIIQMMIHVFTNTNEGFVSMLRSVGIS